MLIYSASVFDNKQNPAKEIVCQTGWITMWNMPWSKSWRKDEQWELICPLYFPLCVRMPPPPPRSPLVLLFFSRFTINLHYQLWSPCFMAVVWEYLIAATPSKESSRRLRWNYVLSMTRFSYFACASFNHFESYINLMDWTGFNCFSLRLVMVCKTKKSKPKREYPV